MNNNINFIKGFATAAGEGERIWFVGTQGDRCEHR